MQSRSFLRRIRLSKKAVCWPKPSGSGWGKSRKNRIALVFKKGNDLPENRGSRTLPHPAGGLAEEVGLISFVRSGRGKSCPVRGRGFDFKSNLLSAEQSAPSAICSRSDQVMLLRGGGPEWARRRSCGRPFLKLRPGDIRFLPLLLRPPRPGKPCARKVSTEPTQWLICCRNKEVQRATKGQFIWIDEAGLLGTRDLWRVMQLAS